MLLLPLLLLLLLKIQQVQNLDLLLPLLVEERPANHRIRLHRQSEHHGIGSMLQHRFVQSP